MHLKRMKRLRNSDCLLLLLSDSTKQGQGEWRGGRGGSGQVLAEDPATTLDLGKKCTIIIQHESVVKLPSGGEMNTIIYQ